MAIEISESDRIAYDELECKNISLERFVLKKLQETVDIQKANNRYRSDVPQFTSKKKPHVPKLICDTEKCVARTIVIDGANIMHGGSPYRDTRDGGHEFIPDVAALLSVIRFFLKRDFEVFAVISRKYMKSSATNFKEAIDELVKNHLCVVVPHTNLDDSVALEFAAQINGVVLTADLYRDHASECSRSRRIVEDHRLGVGWEPIKPSHTRVNYPEEDYIPAKTFFFVNEEGGKTPEEEIIKRVYAFPEQLQYTISKERYRMANPEGKKAKMVGLIEDLIVRGIEVYEENVRIIRNTPLHVPNEASSNSLTDFDETTLLEVPADDQAEYIEQNPEGFESDDW
ncbi:unnamed protein product [Caenorhabditis brenneri]